MAKKKVQEFDASIKTISKELDLFERVVRAHWQSFAKFGVAVLVVVGISMMVSAWLKSARSADAIVVEKAVSETELRKVIAQYPNLPLTAFASDRLAAKLIEDNKVSEALPLYQAAARHDNVAGWIARLNEAYAIEAKGDTKTAASMFAAIAADLRLPSLYQCQAYYAAGRLYAALGDKTKAVSSLKACLEKDSASGQEKWELWPERAKQLLDRIN